MSGVRIAGVGRYLPGPPLDRAATTEMLSRYPDGLSSRMHERLLDETGIETRHFAFDPWGVQPRESNTSMAAAAAVRALADAGWSAADVELLVVTTIVPDHLMPATSTLVQEALDIPRCAEIALSGNCAVPYKAVMIANDQLRLGRCRRALVCAVQYASFLGFPPWTNPASMRGNQGALRWILGDGAGALALERGDPDTELRVWTESTGCGKRPGMSLPLGAAVPDIAGAFARGDQHVTQDARYALKEGMALALDGFARMIDALDVDPRAIDHFVPAVPSQQAVRKFMPLFAERFGIDPSRWRVNLPRVGYLGGVQFIAVLDELTRDGTVRPGDLVCSVAEESSKWMCAAAVFRWNP